MATSTIVLSPMAPRTGYLSQQQLAQHTGLCERTIRTYINRADNPLPVYRMGRRVLIRLDEFERWMEAQRTMGRPKSIEAAREMGLLPRLDTKAASMLGSA